MLFLRSLYLHSLRWGSFLGLRILRSSFGSEDERLKSILEKKGFNRCLVEHPCSLFGERVNKHTRYPKWIMTLCLGIVAEGVKTEALHCPKGNAGLRRIGVNFFYANCVKNFLLKNDNPYREYQIPEKESIVGPIVVYSALTGNYDNVHELLYKEEGVDYLLFTNNKSIHSSTWKVLYVESDLDDVLLSRDIKINPHNYLPLKYVSSVYIDANATIYGNIGSLVKYLSDEVPFVVTKHSKRNTVKEEMEACVVLKGIDRGKILAQYKSYVAEGFCDNLGLAECTILARLHKEKSVMMLMSEWWQEFSSGVRRDQISLMPCISRLHLTNYALIDGNVWCNQFSVIGGHKRS